MAGAAPAAPEKSDSPVHNLLPTKNGLDNVVHFSVQIRAQEKAVLFVVI